MAAVTVARMRVTARPGHIGRARQRGEDALRLASDDDGRLLIVRRLALGVMPADAPPALWQARTAEALRMARLSAVHGGQPGADAAGAVWFRSAEEARTRLMLSLASGVQPCSWFWRRATPDWRGRDAASWVAALVQKAEGRPPELAALARSLIALVEAGHLDAVLSWVAAWPCAPATQYAPNECLERAEALIGRLTPLVRQRLRYLSHDRVSIVWAREALVQMAMIAAAPELASAPLEAQRLAQAWLGARDAPPSRSIKVADVLPPSCGLDEPSYPSTEARTHAAGVMLAIRPLWRMGLGDWLAARPDLLALGLGRALLVHIARRMRAAADDPLCAALDAPPVPDAWRDDLDAWRIGLDRWLRRTARVRLCDIAAKPGWLTIADDAIDLRFGVDQADIRLRRRALDLDPGWVDWLGLVVRYRFRDEP